MKCPFCGTDDTKVIDSRHSEEKKRRRRECTNCKKRFTTYETIDRPMLMVLKKDGSFEQFNRQKVIAGILVAVKKRPITPDQINELVDGIENYYATQLKSEVTTPEIGNMVLMGLKKLDLVAYVRFASVYKHFSDVESFIKIISELDNN